MYCITHEYKMTDGSRDTWYLAWQNPAWDDSGYFWTSKECAISCLHNNTDEHPFLFRRRSEAISHLKTLDIPQRCRISYWDV